MKRQQPAEPSYNEPLADCDCRQCIRDRGDQRWGMPRLMSEFIVCAVCGNKRCPHATNHRHACTDSNEPGQPGSDYGKP
ncbi:hypothetical protein EOM89_06235 [Candidatus Falkowbacteria bacterium]|nr:hypothetical protein [Candidatus Falkowbacteria bacterium]